MLIWEDNREMEIWDGHGELLWIMDSFKVKGLKLKGLIDGFVSWKNTAFLLTRHNWWTGVVWNICGSLRCFYQLFGLLFWRHPFIAEGPLVI